VKERRLVRLSSALSIALSVALLGSCSSRDDARVPATIMPLPRVGLELVADEFDEPTSIVAAPGGGGLWIGERTGRVWFLADGAERHKLVLDLSDRVKSDGQEQGLLGLALDTANTSLLVDFVDRRGENGTTVISRFAVGALPIDPHSGLTLFSVRQPFSNHNGGAIVFGPDQMLYVGLGDGGSQGDPDGNGQSLGTPLGKILRIDPTTGDAPADNPFVDRAGAERRVWALGVRNPWRISFDPTNGDLWIGDVGSDQTEEINRLVAGKGSLAGRGVNLGWNLREGTADTGIAAERSNLADPLAALSHDDGWCAVIGGQIATADAGEGLAGIYIFGDLCQDHLWAIRPGDPPEQLANAALQKLTTFGVGPTGRLYAANLDGEIYRLTSGGPESG